jgi:outer membrane protein
MVFAKVELTENQAREKENLPKGATKPLDLQDIFRLAELHSPMLKSTDLSIAESYIQKKIAIGSFLPYLGLSGVQDIYSSNNGFFPKPWIFLTLRQPILTGLNEYSLIKGSEVKIQLEKENFRLRKQELFMAISWKFFSILEKKALLDLKSRTINFHQQRLSELNNYRRLGKSKASDLESAVAELDKLKGEKTRTSRELNSEQRDLIHLMGISEAMEKSFIQNDLMNNLEPPSLPPVTEEKALSKRPDIRLATLTLKLQELGLLRAKGEYLPNLFLQSNIILREGQGNLNQRINDKWNVQLFAEFPIFSGLRTFHAVKESKIKIKKANLLKKELTNLALQEIRKARENLAYLAEEKKAYHRAYASSKRYYNTMNKEYRLGLTHNIDVLSSLIQLNNAEEKKISIEYTLKANYIWLLVSQGYSAGEILAESK